jgi:hypothetical protein
MLFQSTLIVLLVPARRPWLGNSSPPVSVVSTGIGCPSSAIAVEELIKLGADTFIRVGTSGAIQPDTPSGTRTFRNGMRMINPMYQWPDPDIFVHKQSGRRLVGWEARNLNRNYPGDTTGRLTARLGASIMDFARDQGVDLVYDMHEATPEYPVNNMIIAHERAFEIASYAQWGLQAMGHIRSLCC